MCKFHKDVAYEIATNPDDLSFNPAVYSVALVALSKFRIEQYMPALHGVDGYSRYALASDRGVEAFGQSGLGALANNVPAGMDTLRRAMPDGLTLKGLGLPDNPVRNTAFLDEATVELYEGYAMPGYAAGALSLKKNAHKPAFENLRKATEELLSHEGVEDILRRHFEHSMTRIFLQAQDSVHPSLMKIYNKMPQGLRSVFKSCALCVGPGAGGAVLSHAGCFVVPVIAGATGTAISGGMMTGMMLVGSPLIATGVTYGLDRYQGRKSTALRLGGSAAIAFAVALGLNALGDGHDHHATGHHHGGGGHDHHHHHGHHHGSHGHHHDIEATPEALAWLESQTEEDRQRFLEMAEKSGMGVAAYLKMMCFTEKPDTFSPTLH